MYSCGDIVRYEVIKFGIYSKNFYYHFFHTSHLYHHAMIIASTFDFDQSQHIPMPVLIERLGFSLSFILVIFKGL